MKERVKRGKPRLGKNTAETTELEQEVGRDPMVVVRRRNPVTMLWRAFLAIVRVPEKTLGLLYRYSPVRMLLYKMEWYRDLADQTEIETILEDTYGGASTRLMRMRHFIRRNVLFSVLFCIGIYVAGINLVPMVLNHPTVRVALGKPIIDSDSRIEQIVNTRKTSHLILDRRSNLRRELEHCAVSEKTRLRLLSLLDENAKFVTEDAASCMVVVRRFIAHYDGLDLASETAAAERRQALVEAEFAIILDKITQQLSWLQSSEQQLDNEVAVLRNRKQKVDAASGVRDINQSIKLRDDIQKMVARIDLGPGRDDIASVMSRLQEFKQQVQQPDDAAAMPSLNRVEPDWIDAVVQASKVDVKPHIDGFVSTSLDPLLERLRHHSRPAIATAVLDLPAMMDELAITLMRVRKESKNIVQLLGRRQDTANAQISRFVGQGPDEWLDYHACQSDGYAVE